MSCIEARSLAKSYGNVTAVDGIDLEVPEGQIFGFLGPNGAGKSTTIKMLTTLVQPDKGDIRILDTDAVRHPLDVRKRIGVVLQQPSYEPSLTVSKSLEKYGMMWDTPPAERKERAERLMEEFDLTEIRNRKNVDLSIGQRRRVQVVREFMHDMDLLFLDEPTVGLDPSARRRLMDYLKERARSGLTIFYTTHVLTEAEYICDRIAIINRGKIVAVDTPEELKNRFGQQKTIKIHLSAKDDHVEGLLEHIPDCKIDFRTGTSITIQSDESTKVLAQVLQILGGNGIEVEDLSAVPTNLEEIFLKVVGGSGAPDS
ncbi:ABC-type multidrug transport system, ATPase component [Cenarchaeum symbiosum A]|uniref:ABC-type multidrug transport system, ATPase component n=1 Tax=Cenarchaeum symbiosum (strain A) TaxID=414004 RepID=A0RYZ6_CENSY|nr:ABC-type multidrug transport system, ATPase component [Cenarchaeum symbiosum A]